MSNLLFLLVPIAVAATAVTIMWLRSRPTSSPTAGIDQFSVQMRALAPEDTEPTVSVSPAEPARPPSGHAVVVDDTMTAEPVAEDLTDEPVAEPTVTGTNDTGTSDTGLDEAATVADAPVIAAHDAEPDGPLSQDA